MKVKQHPYLSPEARALRQRDGTPPWGVHPCEVDAFSSHDDSVQTTAFAQSLREARQLRKEIEAAP